MTKEQILSEVSRLVEAGDQKALEMFLLENFKDLPEETQGEMLMSYFKEALAMKEADAKITDLQEAALQALEALQDDKKE